MSTSLFAEFFHFTKIAVCNINFRHIFSQQLYLVAERYMYLVENFIMVVCVTHFQIHHSSTSCFLTVAIRQNMSSVEDPVLSKVSILIQNWNALWHMYELNCHKIFLNSVLWIFRNKDSYILQLEIPFSIINLISN